MKTKSFLSACGLIAAGALLFTSAGPAGAAQGHALTLEGDTVEGAATAISADGKVTIGGKTAELESLRYIAPSTKAGETEEEADESPLRILLICGSDLRAKDLAFDEEDFTFSSASAGKEIVIPVDSVRAVRLALPIEGSRFEETLALEADQRKDDTVYVTGVAGELLELNCLIESITADTVTFDRLNKKQEIPRDKVHGVILASPDLDEPMPTRAIMQDRSSFAGNVIALEDGQLTLEMIDEVEVVLPWENVRRLRIYSPRPRIALRPRAKEGRDPGHPRPEVEVPPQPECRRQRDHPRRHHLRQRPRARSRHEDHLRARWRLRPLHRHHWHRRRDQPPRAIANTSSAVMAASSSASASRAKMPRC